MRGGGGCFTHTVWILTLVGELCHGTHTNSKQLFPLGFSLHTVKVVPLSNNGSGKDQRCTKLRQIHLKFCANYDYQFPLNWMMKSKQVTKGMHEE